MHPGAGCWWRAPTPLPTSILPSGRHTTSLGANANGGPGAAERIDAVLALEGGDPRLLAKAIEASGGIAWWQGDLLRAHREDGEALTLQRSGGDSAELANALYNFGLAQAFAGADSAGSNTVENEAAFQEAEEIYLRLGDQRGLGDVHWGVGKVGGIGQNH